MDNALLCSLLRGSDIHISYTRQGSQSWGGWVVMTTKDFRVGWSLNGREILLYPNCNVRVYEMKTRYKVVTIQK